MNIVDKRNTTALHYASDQGHRDVVSLLLNRGANANAKDRGGSTPLHWFVVDRPAAAVVVFVVFCRCCQ